METYEMTIDNLVKQLTDIFSSVDYSNLGKKQSAMTASTINILLNDNSVKNLCEALAEKGLVPDVIMKAAYNKFIDDKHLTNMPPYERIRTRWYKYVAWVRLHILF